MAETFLSSVIKKLVDLLAEEVNLLKGVVKDVKSLKRELEIIQPFLRDAEVKLVNGELNDAAKVWLKQLREDADHIEDVIDEYIYHVEQHRHQSAVTGFLRKAGHSIKALKPRHVLASQIQDIEKSLGQTMKRGEKLGLRPFEQGARSLATIADATVDEVRMRPLFMEKEELVGIEAMSKDLVEKLVQGPSSRLVVSLVGEGGIGKTTLTKSVYDDEAVRGHFDFYAWITVSQTFDMHEILKTMKRLICRTKEQAGVEIESLEELTNHVQQYLQTKRYVIVFDDVWKTNFWEAIKRALPSDDKGSRIIITTRYTTVADSFRETAYDHIEKLNSWSPDLAWELFCKKAFCSEFERCPKELEQLSRQIVDKCQGLPLVIAAVAGLLSKKKTKLEWQRVLDNLNYEFEENDKLATVSKVLLLSYHDLPYHLKPCLLYFGIFPEDYPIHHERLYRLWIAEGFIKSRGNMTFEQVAEEYLNQLIDRNLVSFEVRNREERYCRVHDLTHEMILKIAIELCFFQTSNTGESRFREKSRRIFSNATTRDILENAGHSRTRSVFLCNMDKLTPSFVVQLLESFKLLKVLDFENAPLSALPKEVGNLLLLKYLSLRNTKVQVLPKSIGKLSNLQTLNVTGTLVQELPIEINKLRNLQYLAAYYWETGKQCAVRMHEGIGRLEELQTLYAVATYPNSVGIIKELRDLTKLKVLGISGLTAEVGTALEASIEKLNHLERLTLEWTNQDEPVDLKWSIHSYAPFLSYLSMDCWLQEFPDWIPKLENLRGLRLSRSRLMDEPLKYLKGLPNLAYLYMNQTYDGEELHFEEGSFQKLKKLQLIKLGGLKVVKIDKQALPLLEDWNVGPFPLMEILPDIQHLTNLKSLDMEGIPTKFAAALQPDGGPEYWRIQHIPSVYFRYKDEGGTNSSKAYKLGSPELLQLLQKQAS